MEKLWKPEFGESLNFEYPHVEGINNRKDLSFYDFQDASERYEVPGILPKVPVASESVFLP